MGEMLSSCHAPAELLDPVVCWLRDGKWQRVGFLTYYLLLKVDYRSWLAAFYDLEPPHGPQVPPGTTADDKIRLGCEAVLSSVFAALAEKGQCETKGKGRGWKVRLLGRQGPELGPRIAAMDAAVAAAARAALDWLADGQRLPERELNDRLSAALPDEWDPITKDMLLLAAFQALQRDQRFRSFGPSLSEQVVWLEEVPGTKGQATGGGGEGAGGGAAASDGAAPPTPPRPAVPPPCAGGAGRQGPDGWTQLVQTLDMIDGLLDGSLGEVEALAPRLSGEERAGLEDRLGQVRAKVDRMARALAEGGATRRPHPASSRAVPWGPC